MERTNSSHEKGRATRQNKRISSHRSIQPLQLKSLGGATEGPAITWSPGTTFVKEQPITKGAFDIVPEGLLQKMKAFQQHNNLPIHLKGGPADKVFFTSTLVLCAVGLTGCFKFFYDMSFPKKAQE